MGFVHAEYSPSPELRPFVQCYSIFVSGGPGRPGEEANASLLADEDPLVDRVFACAHNFLSFSFADPLLEWRDGREVPLKERAHVVGAITQPGTMPLPARVDMFGVTFRPGWAHHFLRVPAEELTDQALALEHFWGAAGRALEDQLLEAPSARQRIEIVERELRRRLESAPPLDGTIPALADHVLRLGGAVTVEQLSAACGFTRQHLARKFRHFLGLGPKLFCRLVRFQNALTRVTTSPPDSWAVAAVELGYYDQAHLIAEFKEFTGFTPAGFTSLR
jgi:AraC-like DNA-binding protein